jgi:UDP-glucose:(heptosyl)LPS alpha-1,3-glucosyltransferase
MKIAMCYESVLPTRGGCETYIAALARRLTANGHAVHLYSCRWDAASLPNRIHYHRLPAPAGPRFLRPWQFAASCEQALRVREFDLSIGFDKTWGQDILYPQGGLHAASVEHNTRKHSHAIWRVAARAAKRMDPATQSFSWLERKQYVRQKPRAIIANSEMVGRHFHQHYGITRDQIHVVHAAVDPERFQSDDRTAIRAQIRSRWKVDADVPVALFVAMNYRLKGLEPLLRAVQSIPRDRPFRLAIVGHPKTRRYMRLAARLGVADRVVFHGFCGDSRMVYFASDFLVHPTFYDPCSLVVLEALACGLPVVTSRFNGASELLHPPHDGLVIDDPHDHERLAAAIVHFLDADYRRTASRAALDSAKLWTFDDHYRKMMTILELAAHRQSSRAA